MLRYFRFALLLLLLFTGAQVFPLQTPDGIIKIYGMIPTSDGFALDILYPYEF